MAQYLTIERQRMVRSCALSS